MAFRFHRPLFVSFFYLNLTTIAGFLFLYYYGLLGLPSLMLLPFTFFTFYGLSLFAAF